MTEHKKANETRTNVTIQNKILGMVDVYKDTDMAIVTGMDSRAAFFEVLALAFFAKMKGKDKLLQDLLTLTPEDLARYGKELKKMRLAEQA